MQFGKRNRHHSNFPYAMRFPSFPFKLLTVLRSPGRARAVSGKKGIKEELPTSNIESNRDLVLLVPSWFLCFVLPNCKQPNEQCRYFLLFSAVLMLVTKILINSSVSFMISSSSSGFEIKGTR